MSTVVQLNLLPDSSNRLSHLKTSQLSPLEQDHLIRLALEILSQRYQFKSRAADELLGFAQEFCKNMA